MKLGDINNFIGDIDLELLDQLLKGRFNDRHRLLEIGCGQGRNIIPFLNLEKVIYGIDLDEKNVALCKLIATSLGGDPSFFSKANAQGYCNTTGASEDADGVITFTGEEGSMGFCAFAPDEYTIKIYKMALCTTAPTRPTLTDTYDVSSCVDVINSPD